MDTKTQDEGCQAGPGGCSAPTWPEPIQCPGHTLFDWDAPLLPFRTKKKIVPVDVPVLSLVPPNSFPHRHLAVRVSPKGSRGRLFRFCGNVTISRDVHLAHII